MDKRLVAIVTGANSGVGLGICQRLLSQLSLSKPTDGLPLYPNTVEFVTNGPPSPYAPCEALTLVLACRSKARAEEAKAGLLRKLDAEIRKRKRRKDYDGHADRFRSQLEITFVPVDLASVDSVFDFCDEIARRYTYITHLFMNAGVGSWARIDYFFGIWEVLKGPVLATTHPTYKHQGVGDLSKDGLGWVWQANLFGHYLMYRTLRPLLREAPGGCRVLWTTSIESHPRFYEEAQDDFQMLKTNKSYEAVKYATELVAHGLNVTSKANAEKEPKIRHIVTHPGIVASSILLAYNGIFFHYLMIAAFYLARLCGSDHHPISTYKGAFSAVYIALVSTVFLPPAEEPIRFASRTTFFGQEYVGEERMVEWEEKEMEAAKVIGKLDLLCANYTQLREEKETEDAL